MRRLFKAKSKNNPSTPAMSPTGSANVHHILQLQRTIGNQATLRYIQRDPLDEEAAFNAPISPEQNRENWDVIVADELERYLQSFMNIPVRVTYEEDGQPMETIVYVHPPYVMRANDDSLEKTKERWNTAVKNREDSSKADRAAFNAASGPAKSGKARRDEIKLILETAVQNGAIPTPPGKKHPEGQDLRDWLIKYGISVDCSGFVGYAINDVMSHMHMMAGAEDEFDLFSGSGAQMKSTHKRLAQLNTPAEMRPGTLQHIPGHIRIVLTVEREGDAVIFTTAESTAGKGTLHDEEGADKVKDVGPRRARWKYKEAGTAFSDQNLYMDIGEGTWARQKKRPVYTRVKAMDEFQDSHQPEAEDFTLYDYSDDYGTIITAAEQTVDEANAAAPQ